MNDEVKATLDKLKRVGSNLTFEGGFVADFIERLDRIVEVNAVKMDGNTLKVLVGEEKSGSTTDILSVVAKATLLNVAAAGYEETPHGMMIYFEYYIPPWNQFEV